MGITEGGIDFDWCASRTVFFITRYACSLSKNLFFGLAEVKILILSIGFIDRTMNPAITDIRITNTLFIFVASKRSFTAIWKFACNEKLYGMKIRKICTYNNYIAATLKVRVLFIEHV